MGQPRILVFVHSFESGRFALRLAAAWQAAGAEVCVVMRRGDGARRGAATGLACESGVWTACFETLWLIGCLPAAVRRFRPDVVFCAGGSDAVVAAALRWRLGDACPPIVMRITDDLVRRDRSALLRWGYRRWLRWQGRSIDHFVGMATSMRAEIATALQIAPARVSIVEDPVLTAAEVAQLFVRQRRRDGTRQGHRYVAAGRLVAPQNFALLIAAFADIATPRDRLTIIGEGPQRRMLKRLAHDLGVADRVVLPGQAAVSGSWLAAADVFVLSSNYDGVPAVVVEALAAGLPIVATDCSAVMVKLLDHGRLGRLVPVGDRARLGHALGEVATLTTCSACSLAQAARFTVEAAALHYLELFSRLARGDDAPAVDGAAGLDRCAACRSQLRRCRVAPILMEA